MKPIQIALKQDMPGFECFLGPWVCRGNINIVIDVGPSGSIPALLESLSAMGMESIDYVLLTHIHIDHAGGLGELLEHFPSANVICHEKGIRHLVDPSRLWEGSLKTLGEMARSYGPIKPVPAGVMIPHTDAVISGLDIIETPGHAAHHLSFCYERNLFVGEAGGNFFNVEDKEYLRPATPSRFFLEESLDSVDRLLDLEDQRICYAHFGSVSSSIRMLKRYRNQLLRWKEVLLDELKNPNSHIIGRCVKSLFQKDIDLRAVRYMSPELQMREKHFMGNSVKGYLEYLTPDVPYPPVLENLVTDFG